MCDWFRKSEKVKQFHRSHTNKQKHNKVETQQTKQSQSHNRTQQTNLTYRVNNNTTTYDKLTLIDRQCNGSLGGDDMLQMGISDFQKVDIVGIKNTKCENLPV